MLCHLIVSACCLHVLWQRPEFTGPHLPSTLPSSPAGGTHHGPPGIHADANRDSTRVREDSFGVVRRHAVETVGTGALSALDATDGPHAANPRTDRDDHRSVAESSGGSRGTSCSLTTRCTSSNGWPNSLAFPSCIRWYQSRVRTVSGLDAEPDSKWTRYEYRRVSPGRSRVSGAGGAWGSRPCSRSPMYRLNVSMTGQPDNSSRSLSSVSPPPGTGSGVRPPVHRRSAPRSGPSGTSGPPPRAPGVPHARPAASP